VHFYSTFWRSKRSNRRSVTRWAGRCRATTSRVARAGASATTASESGPLAPSRDHAARGGEHSEGPLESAPRHVESMPSTLPHSVLSTGPSPGSRHAPVEDAPYCELRRDVSAVASSCACRPFKGSQHPQTPPPPPPHCFLPRRRPPWGLLGERRPPLPSVAVQLPLHLPRTPWKPPLPPLPTSPPPSPEQAAAAATSLGRQRARPLDCS
jgi:hypothetical protein